MQIITEFVCVDGMSCSRGGVLLKLHNFISYSVTMNYLLVPGASVCLRIERWTVFCPQREL